MESRQVGLVKSVSGESAVVQVRRQGGCSEKCSHGQIFGNANTELTIQARNVIGARVGDWVQVAYDGGLVLRAAFAIYILPILLGLAAYLISDALLAESYSLVVSIITGAVLILSFQIAFRHFSRSRFEYAIVAEADETSLPLAPGCQGCGLAKVHLDE